MRRVLKPGGALAVWGYGAGAFTAARLPVDDPTSEAALLGTLNEAFVWLYRGSGEGGLGQNWDERRWLVDGRYAGLDPGPDDFRRVERAELEMAQELPLEGLVSQGWARPGLRVP